MRQATNIALEIVAFFLFLGVLLFLICIEALLTVIIAIGPKPPKDWSKEYGRYQY